MRRADVTSLITVALVFAAEAIFAPPVNDVLNVPTDVKGRRAIPLPSVETIELTLHQTAARTLQNVLDLDVAACNLDAFGSGMAALAGQE